MERWHDHVWNGSGAREQLLLVVLTGTKVAPGEEAWSSHSCALDNSTVALSLCQGVPPLRAAPAPIIVVAA